MRHSLAFALVSILAVGGTASSMAEPQRAIADNGREVILNDNGEWEYANDDMYATTKEGNRVRLSPNGKWQPVKQTAAPAPKPAPVYQPAAPVYQSATPASVPRDRVILADQNQGLTLDQVVIETHREAVGKNTRKRSNLVFYLDTEGQAVSLNPNDIWVQDSKGRDYPVFAVNQGKSPVGNHPRLVIRANGAPRWWGVKYFSLQFKPNSIGNSQTIELRKTMSDVVRKEVNQLPETNF